MSHSPDLFDATGTPGPSTALQGSRAVAALVGGAFGDALGWPFESNNRRLGGRESLTFTGRFVGWERRVGGRFYPCAEAIAPGEYSDDTQLTLATTRALLKGRADWWHHFVQLELPVWLLYERGGGRALKASASAWLAGRAPWEQTRWEQVAQYFSAGGNGAAMRIAPHAIVSGTDRTALRSAVLHNAAATHGHPRALVGALVFATACQVAFIESAPWALGGIIEALLDHHSMWGLPVEHGELPVPWHDQAIRQTGESYASVWSTAVAEVEEGLQRARHAVGDGATTSDREVLESFGAFDRRISGAGTVSALATVYLAARYAADPVTGVRTAASSTPADTDTIASMTGTLLGAMLGTEWLPTERRLVQDFSHLEHVAHGLFQSASAPQPAASTARTEAWTDRQSSELVRALEESSQPGETGRVVQVGPLGPCRVEPATLRPLSARVQGLRWRLQTEEGQSFYVSRFLRLGAAKPPRTGTTDAAEQPEVEAPVEAGDQVSTGHKRTRGARVLAEIRAVAAEAEAAGVASVALLSTLEHLVRVVLRERRKASRPLAPSPAELDAWWTEAAPPEVAQVAQELRINLTRLAWRLAVGGHAAHLPPS